MCHATTVRLFVLQRGLWVHGDLDRPASGWLALLSPLLLLAGCQEPPPALETHAVIGTVQFNNGDAVKSGYIEFRSKRDQRLSMNAEILEDGSFELTTMHGNQSLEGAVEGPCGVMVTIDIPGSPIPLTLDLPDTFEVKSGDNDFDIKLKLPPPPK